MRQQRSNAVQHQGGKRRHQPANEAGSGIFGWVGVGEGVVCGRVGVGQSWWDGGTRNGWRRSRAPQRKLGDKQ